MAGNDPENQKEDNKIQQSLMSLEKLDRSSPDLWPENISGLNEFVSAFTPPNHSPPSWTKGLSDEDINFLHQLGSLPKLNLLSEVQKLHNLAYQLGQEEAKEVTRGKCLNIFKNKRKR